MERLNVNAGSPAHSGAPMSTGQPQQQPSNVYPGSGIPAGQTDYSTSPAVPSIAHVGYPISGNSRPGSGNAMTPAQPVYSSGGAPAVYTSAAQSANYSVAQSGAMPNSPAFSNALPSYPAFSTTTPTNPSYPSGPSFSSTFPSNEGYRAGVPNQGPQGAVNMVQQGYSQFQNTYPPAGSTSTTATNTTGYSQTGQTFNVPSHSAGYPSNLSGYPTSQRPAAAQQYHSGYPSQPSAPQGYGTSAGLYNSGPYALPQSQPYSGPGAGMQPPVSAQYAPYYPNAMNQQPPQQPGGHYTRPGPGAPPIPSKPPGWRPGS